MPATKINDLEHAKFSNTANGPAVKVVNADGTAIVSTLELDSLVTLGTGTSFIGLATVIVSSLPTAYVAEPQLFSHAHFTSLTSQTLKTGPGALHAININTPVGNGVISAFDGIDDSATPLLTITKPGTLLSDGPNHMLYNISTASGLHITTTGAIQDVTVSYR